MSQLDARHQAVEVRCGLGNHTNRTYISGRTDYLVLTTTTSDENQKPGCVQASPTVDQLTLKDCMPSPILDYVSNHLVSQPT